MMHYRTLFNGIFHHEYHMDDGETRFFDLSAQEQELVLRNYSVWDYLSIRPTPTTLRLMTDHMILFKKYPQGFRLVSECLANNVSGTIRYSPKIILGEDLALNFQLYATDPYFEHYTLTTPKDNNQLYFFTNSASKAGIGAANVLSDDGTVDSTFLLTVPHSRRLIHQDALEAEKFKTYVDPYAIAAIPLVELDTTETMARLHPIIQSKKRNGFLGTLRLYVSGDASRHLVEWDTSDPSNLKQYIISPIPTATLKLKNRTTFWRYITRATNTIWTTTAKKPLTRNGFVAIENTDLNPQPAGDIQLPNPDVRFIRKESSDYYSEIYL